MKAKYTVNWGMPAAGIIFQTRSNIVSVHSNMLSNTLDLCEFILFDLSALCFRIAAVYSFTVFGTICPHLVIVCFLRRKLLIYIRNSASLFNR